MADVLCNVPVASARTGAEVPLYFDGQVVRAADLTLDRSSHDEELWRLRRLLHGWGIVAGLTVEIQSDSLIIRKGYGLCPSGDEVHLPDAIEVTDVVKKMFECCGPDAKTCALDDGEGSLPGELDMSLSHESDEGGLTVWVVLRPVRTPAALRAGLPQDCAHPGNHLSPSRLCGSVNVEFHCTLPDGHDPERPDCRTMQDFLCGDTPLAMFADHPQPGLIVIAGLRYGAETIDVFEGVRRRLLPMSVLQDYVRACACDKKQEEPAPEATVAASDGNDVIVVDAAPTAPTTRPERPKGPKWKEVVDFIEEVRDVKMIPEPGVKDPAGPVIHNSVVEKLIASEVSPADILTMKPEVIALRAGIDLDVAVELKNGIGGAAGFITSPRF